MTALYLDTSAFLAVLFGEPGSERLAAVLRGAGQILSSGLLEAEARAAGVRRGRPPEEMDRALGPVSLFHPERSLGPEIKSVLSAAPFLRGADAWHLACALYLAGDPSNLPVVTLDADQAGAARRLGFRVLPEGAAGAGEPPAVYGTGSPAKPGPRRRKRSRRKKAKA